MYVIESSLSVTLRLYNSVVPLNKMEITAEMVTDVKYMLGDSVQLSRNHDEGDQCCLGVLIARNTIFLGDCDSFG